MEKITYRKATPADVPAISTMLEALVAAGKRTLPADPEFVLTRYVAAPNGISCTVAVGDGGRILGVQPLSRALDENPYGTPVGWGIIGTHVAPDAARLGIGRGMFQQSLVAARDASLTDIEAFIGSDNEAALTYYEAMGFRTWRKAPGRTPKRLHL